MGADPRRLGGLALAASCGFALLIGASAAAVGKTTVRTANASSLGTIVVGPTGRTVYRFLGEADGRRRNNGVEARDDHPS
jgi:hypothetical protein